MLEPQSRDSDETATAGVGTAPPEPGDGRSLGDVDHDDRLIRWMLALTPGKRLEALQNFVDGIVALRHARKIAQ